MKCGVKRDSAEHKRTSLLVWADVGRYEAVWGSVWRCDVCEAVWGSEGLSWQRLWEAV